MRPYPRRLFRNESKPLDEIIGILKTSIGNEEETRVKRRLTRGGKSASPRQPDPQSSDLASKLLNDAFYAYLKLINQAVGRVRPATPFFSRTVGIASGSTKRTAWQKIERPKTEQKKWLKGTEDNHGSNVREVGTPLSATYVIARPGPK